jgi:hypothetical protein
MFMPEFLPALFQIKVPCFIKIGRLREMMKEADIEAFVP